MTSSLIPIRARSASQRRCGSAGGFTLIELMITVAIAGIFASLAAPAMTTIIRNNRVQSEASSLVSDLQLARNEAIKRGSPVAVCPAAADGGSCITANTWQNGWITFTDLNGNGVYDSSTETVLRWRKALSSTDTIVASTKPTTNSISFNRDGFATGMGTTTTMMQVHTANNDTTATRCISVDLGGRLSTLIYGGTSMTVSCS
jgi:type IV fimbrial biogenesis protein FimT